MAKKTPLYDEHLKLGARIINFSGWLMPVQYTSIIEEHNNTRANAGLFDTSHMGEIPVKGKHAFDLLQKIVSRDISRLEKNKIFLVTMTNEKGGLIDDLTVYKFADDEFMLVVNALNVPEKFAWIKKARDDFGFDAEISDKTDFYAKIDLQGPKAQQILQKTTDFYLNQIKFYSFDKIKVFAVEAIVSRSGYTGENGFEIYFDSRHASEIWNKLLETGKESGLKPAGLGARARSTIPLCAVQRPGWAVHRPERRW